MASVTQATQANLEGQTPLFHEEYRVRARSGEWKWVLDVGKVMAWDEQGRPVRAAGIHQDITVRKQAEEALRESKEWLELVVTAADLGTWDFRVSTNQVVYNRRWAEMLGYTLAELESTINGWEKLIHPEDFAGVRAAVNAHMRGEIHLYQHEHRLRSKSGEWQWVMDTGQAVEQDEQGRPVRVVGIQQDITERKRTEAALRASEARFATIFQASPLSISIVRLTDHQFVDVNWAWETKSGFSREETIGRTPLELNLWVNPDARAQFLMQLSEQSTVQGLEAQFRLKSGVVVDVLISAELIDLPGERCMLMITQNITERKRMEVELRTSEQKFRQLIEQSADGFVLTDHRGYVSEWNRMAEQITGLTRAETMGRPSWELQFALLPAERRTPATFERLKTFVQAYLQTGEDPLFNQAYEFELQGSDGSYRDIQEVGFPIKTEAGFWRGGIIRDVTERRQVERIETAQLVVSQVLAQSPEPTVALRQVLEAIAQRMNWDFAELWRPNHDNRRLVWHNGWYTPDLPILAEFMQTGQTLTFEPGQGLVGRVWQTGQTIWDQNLHLPVRSSTMLVTGLHSVTGVPIIEDGETVGVMVFFSRSTRPLDERLLTVLTDLGRQIGQFLARKQAEADLAAERASLARRVEERTAELSQANADLTRALRVKNEFMSTVTHELRTPLMGILGMSEIMQEQFFGPLNERQLEQVKLIEMSGQRLLGLVNNILDLTHLEASKMELQPEKISVAEMCRVSVQSVSEAAHKKNLTLSCHLPDQSLYLQADPPRLQQILVNLLDNAIKFTPAGGQVSLEVTPDPADKLVHFAVQDNGIGIKVEQMERLFQPFTQLDSSLSRSYEGTGLGLALVRRLAELHGGTVSVESKGVAGKGSRFIVSLPWQVPHQ
ncbi:MAG: PAS domain S-box protein [Anaerolineae bacterium]